MYMYVHVHCTCLHVHVYMTVYMFVYIHVLFSSPSFCYHPPSCFLIFSSLALPLNHSCLPHTSLLLYTHSPPPPLSPSPSPSPSLLAAETSKKTSDDATAVTKETESNKTPSATSGPPTTGECVHMFYILGECLAFLASGSDPTI